LNARDYYLDRQTLIHRCPHVLRSDTRFEEIDVDECYVRGVLWLVNGFELHIAEYVTTEPKTRRVKYRCHLPSADGELVARWDNAPHHPDTRSFPDHRHSPVGVHSSPEMSIPAVLDALLAYI
jgi:hypothetical protein